MKLEKVLNRPKKGVWIFLFILGLVVAGTMAISYNVEILNKIPTTLPTERIPENFPIAKIILGALGFFGILGSIILLFIRLLREMKVSQIQADFLDRISHELRTPLATLTLVADLLKADAGEAPAISKEESIQLWKAHDLELSRLKMDVELLLQAAHLRESKWKPTLQLVNLEQWLTEHWDTFKLLLGPQARFERAHEVIFQEVWLDPALLELIFRNLLDNARKFSFEQPVVWVKTEIIYSGFIFKNKKWRIRISDEGLGFQPKHQSQLFKRFSRLPFKRAELKSHSIPGTGLGLYLSAMASKAMGLTLTGLSSGEGKGAQFTLEGKFS